MRSSGAGSGMVQPSSGVVVVNGMMRAMSCHLRRHLAQWAMAVTRVPRSVGFELVSCTRCPPQCAQVTAKDQADGSDAVAVALIRWATRAAVHRRR